MENISVWIAFLAGFASFFSPCIIPLIPAYISFVSGDMEKYYSVNFNYRPFIRTLGFAFGFSAIFILLGASLTLAGSLLSKNLIIFRRISGLIIIAFGLYMLDILKISAFNSQRKVFSSKKPAGHFLYAVLMGMAFSLGWTPCTGPILASILLYAGSSGTVSQGILLLAFYSLGLTIPFVISSLLLGIFTNSISKLEKAAVFIRYISGMLLIYFGFLIFFDRLTDILRYFT